ncbi:MAG: tetratricopeptide repeat protein [Ignavibacteria bacterium]|nr:tetratricopeptide repeat protein [Ignavibacteria bacterium]
MKKLAANEEAAPMFLEALRIRKEILGENHPRYATGLHNLAQLYKTIRDYEKAEPLYLEAMRIFRENLGEVHPDYAASPQ